MLSSHNLRRPESSNDPELTLAAHDDEISLAPLADEEEEYAPVEEEEDEIRLVPLRRKRCQSQQKPPEEIDSEDDFASPMMPARLN